MQRIDENTYIDDTLVTCAEYQLFIDEMREQGKYYQPDHWNSYQFPEGQAQEPILGARHSDAVAFCEWLTSREGKEWKYRIPTKEEAKALTKKPISIDPLGYWIDEKISGEYYAWITYLLDARSIRSIRHNQGVRVIAEANLPKGYFDSAVNHRMSLPLDIGSAIEKILSKDNLKQFCFQYFFAFVQNKDNRIFNTRLGWENRFIYILSWMREKEFFSNDVQNHDYDIETMISFSIDLLTVYERIAGRSPAFEGIRLVKERTK